MHYTWPLQRIWVDLTQQTIRVEAFPKDFSQKFLGARGFNSRLLFDLVSSDTDPLGPKNVFIVGIGPLCGTKTPASSRFTITTKSPLTDIYATSNCGGSFGPELRFAGYSQLIIQGKSESPVYLFIKDDQIQIKDAGALWGKTNNETQALIRQELEDPRVKILSIGPAGENLVRFAAIMHTNHNYAARVGVGAVLGSKNLKAIVVRGTHKVEPVDQASYDAVAKEMSALLKEATRPDFITLDFLEVACERGFAPVRGNRGKTHVWPYASRLGGTRFREEFVTKRSGCYNCTIRCKRSYKVQEGKFAGVEGGGPEFSVTAYAPVLDIREFEPILQINTLLNNYGMDCSSFLQMMTWAMECYEHGIITEEDTNGLELTWGNTDAIIQLVHQVANRQGFGDILAEGEKRAPLRIKRGSEKYIYHCKGISIVSDPRVRTYWGLAELTNTRGGEHLAADYAPSRFPQEFVDKYIPDNPQLADPTIQKGKGSGLKWSEDWTAFINACGLCIFVWHPAGNANIPFIQVPELLGKMITATTGVNYDYNNLITIGERIYNVEKAFNTREGLTRVNDASTLQSFFQTVPIKDGPGKGQTFNPDPLLDEYYIARGWNQNTSLPTTAKLAALGLQEVASKLKLE